MRNNDVNEEISIIVFIKKLGQTLFILTHNVQFKGKF